MHLRHQAGMGMSGWLVILVVVLSLLTLAVRIVPHYLDHSTIDGLITELLEDPDTARFTPRQFNERLLRNMKLNNIREFELDDRIVFERESGIIDVTFAYEVREPLFLNIDLILKFDETYEKVVR